MVSMKMHGLRKLAAFARDGMWSSWKIPADVVSKSFQEVIKVARQLENTVQPLVWLGFYPSEIKHVNHEALQVGSLEGGLAASSVRAELFGAATSWVSGRRGLRHYP